MRLIVSEKHSVAVSIGNAIGSFTSKKGYIENSDTIITWCVGHLVGLAEPDAYDTRYARRDLADLPIIPAEWQTAVLEDSKDQFRVLASLMKDRRLTSIVCATDAGREGELIFRLVYQQVKPPQVPVKRLWISSMEESAIRNGLNSLKDDSVYDDLYDAALCRAQADWLIGMNGSRLFSGLHKALLRVGRVQTPTLAMIVERDRSIKSFVKEKYHTVKLEKDGLVAETEVVPLEDAKQIQAACHNRQAACSFAQRVDHTANPPKLYDLTSLQRDANRYYGLTAQDTLNAAQSLYEKKLFTYPRTDSRYITSDMRDTVASLVTRLAGDIQTTGDVSRLINDCKVTDHHAILPTAAGIGIDHTDPREPEQQVYHLVATRLLSASAEPQLFAAITAHFDCAGHQFTAKGKTELQAGWMAVERQLLPVTEKEKRPLPDVQMGQQFENVMTSVCEHETNPPKHFTEDTLLAAMEVAGVEELVDKDSIERKGLGTPATRAAVIEKLVRDASISRKGKNLISTERGVALIDILPDVLKSPLLTAQWENQLTEIAQGKVSKNTFMRGIEQMVRELVSEFGAAGAQAETAFVFQRQRQGEIIGKCPRCKGNVAETPKAFSCGCGFTMWKENKWWTDKKKSLTKTIAAALLKNGKTTVKGFYSKDKNKTYAAAVRLVDTGDRVVYKLEF